MARTCRDGVTVTGTVPADPDHYARPVGAHLQRSITVWTGTGKTLADRLW